MFGKLYAVHLIMYKFSWEQSGLALLSANNGANGLFKMHIEMKNIWPFFDLLFLLQLIPKNASAEGVFNHVSVFNVYSVLVVCLPPVVKLKIYFIYNEHTGKCT